MSVSSLTSPERLGGTPVSPGVVVLVAALCAAMIAQGGYYLPGRLLVTALVAVAVTVALTERGWSRPERGPVTLLCTALAGWALIRGLAGPASAPGGVNLRAAFGTQGTVGPASAVAATVAGLAAAAFLTRRARGRTGLAAAVLAVGVLLAATSWIGLVWRIQPWGGDMGGIWRGSSTLTYPNAAAALLTAFALLAVALSTVDRTPAAAGAGYLLLVGLVTTLSRAGMLALGVGLLALAALVGVRRTVTACVAPLLGAAVAAASLLPGLPASAPARPGVAVGGLLVGLALTLALHLTPGPVRIGALIAAAGLSTAAASGVLDGVLPRRLPSLGAGVNVIDATSRFSLNMAGRSDALRPALAAIRAHPVLGVGPGQASFAWTGPYHNGMIARYAHDEYLQLTVELGVVGLALLVGLLVAVVRAVHRGRPVPAGGAHAAVWAGAAAALVALAVHSAFDFLWQLPVTLLAAGLFIGLASAPVPVGPPPPTTGRTVPPSVKEES